MMNNRKLLSIVILIVIGLSVALASSGSARVLHGSSAVNRVLIVGMGQSNMGVFFGNPGSGPPAPNAGTQYWNGTSYQPVPLAIAMRTLQNTVNNVTGLPNVSINCAQEGTPLAGFVSGQSAFSGCVNQVNAIITPQDSVFLIWDQGEGDTNTGGQPYNYYAPTLAQMHSDFAAAIGRTVTTAPLMIAQIGTASDLPGQVSNGTTGETWNTIQNGLAWTPFYDSGAIFSHTNEDFIRGDGYHYQGQGSLLAGQRYAQAILTKMGMASGYPNFNIASSSTVDATHTTVAVTQNLGTDFTPTSGGTSFEVSGNNGASWSNAVSSRLDASHITLTHSSLTTTNARLVRYAYGFSPPDADITCYGAPGPICNPPSALIHDNSALAIPLTPTDWNLRPTPTGAVLPMATYRGEYTGVHVGPCGTPCTDTVSGMLLGPENQRKFVVLALAGINLPFSPITAFTVTPQDYLGNNVGSTITPSFTPIVLAGGSAKLALLSFAMNANNAAATTFKIDISYSQNTFGISTFDVWTIPFADLSSTTPVASNTAATTATTAITTTLNTSAGGLAVCEAGNSTGPAVGALTGTIVGNLLTASAPTKAIVLGQSLASAIGGGFGAIVPGTTITAFVGGSGGAGTYNVSPSQNIAGNSSFTGQITGTPPNLLTVTGGVTGDPLVPGQIINGAGVSTAPAIVINSNGTGTGGNGTYNLSAGQGSVVGPEAMTVSPAAMQNGTNFAVPSSSSGEAFALRHEAGVAAMDSANSAGSTPASATITFNDSGDLNLVCASWR